MMISSSSSSNAQPCKTPSLPLEWTKISRRKRRRLDNGSQLDQGKGWECCEDDSCLNNEKRYQPEKEEATSNKSNAALLSGNEQALTQMITLHGKGIFCLHELDCKWFQGHFLPSSVATGATTGEIANSIGLLVTEREDVEDCLQCANDAYRELDMTLLRSSTSHSLGFGAKRKELKVQRLICTGGDMLRIHMPPLPEVENVKEKISSHTLRNEINFEAEKLITGVKVEPLVQRYFSNLVARMHPTDSESPKKTVSISDILPHCAVVVGDMSVTVPSQFVCGMKRNVDEDEGWMSD